MSNILKCAFHKSTNSRDGSRRRGCRRECFERCEFIRGRETVLKPEQESAVRALLADRDVLAVLRTGYGKSLIYQMFVCAKNYELSYWVDYVLEGSAFILRKCYFSRMFHTERS